MRLYLQWPESVANVATTASTAASMPSSPHGEGRPTSGRGRSAPLPAVPAAAQTGSTEAEVQLQGWAPFPRVRRPLAAALMIDNNVAEAALSLTRNDRTPTVRRVPTLIVRGVSASDGSAAGDSATCQVAMPHAEPVADAVPATS